MLYTIKILEEAIQMEEETKKLMKSEKMKEMCDKNISDIKNAITLLKQK